MKFSALIFSTIAICAYAAPTESFLDAVANVVDIAGNDISQSVSSGARAVGEIAYNTVSGIADAGAAIGTGIGRGISGIGSGVASVGTGITDVGQGIAGQGDHNIQYPKAPSDQANQTHQEIQSQAPPSAPAQNQN